MRRVRDVRLAPLAWVAVVAAVAAVVRFALALQVRTPLYYPDEYRSTALARSIADGGLPRVRGEFIALNFTSYVPTILQAPAWLIEDVGAAYRVAQAFGSVAFAAAAFPAYLLARQVGITGQGSVLVAGFALLIPAGAYTSTLLSEPYAYTAFLLAVVLALRTLAAPTVGLHLTTLAVAAGLCFVGGLQFVFFGLGYVAAWLLAEPRTPRALLGRAVIVAVGVALCLTIFAFVAGGRFLDILVNTARLFDYAPGPVAAWFGANAFVLAISAGWLLLPGALLGLYGLARSTRPLHRTFVLLSVLLLVAILAEAAIMSRTFGLHERFAFYGAPFLAIGFVWAVERGGLPRRAYIVLAYAAAATAILLPTTTLIEGTLDHSPTMLGLFEVSFGDEIGPLVWAPVLAALALAVAWRGLAYPRAVVLTSAALGILLSIGTSITYINVARGGAVAPRVGAPEGSTFVTWSAPKRFSLQETLFWNPEITRVAVLVPDTAADAYGAIRARLSPGNGLVDDAGRELPGPYVFGPDTAVLGVDTPRSGENPFVTLAEAPSGVVFGLYPSLGRMGMAGYIHAGATRRSRLTVALRSPEEDRVFGVSCNGGIEREARVGDVQAEISIPVEARSVRSCLFLITGGLEPVGDDYRVGARASVSLDE